jgi:ABC-type multidrug transport system fused ATPase/permease subunit
MVAILTIATRFSVSPVKTGLTLAYILSVQAAFGWLVRQTAEMENNMNSVERILHYGHVIEQEPPHELPERRPHAPWPSGGRVELQDVVLSYRPGLPSVLKGLSMSVKAGEKIGIVGRSVVPRPIKVSASQCEVIQNWGREIVAYGSNLSTCRVDFWLNIN